MKAKLFAVVLSFFVVVFSVQSTTSLTSTDSSVQKVNLNKATVQMLSHACKGIGKKRAEAIVNYREQHGQFKSVMDLSQVKGIGKQFVKRHQIQLESIFTTK